MIYILRAIGSWELEVDVCVSGQPALPLRPRFNRHHDICILVSERLGIWPYVQDDRDKCITHA